MSLEATPDAGGWLGRVTIAGPRALEREVRGERCEDVVAALALITVLRFEGGDRSEQPPAEAAASLGAGAVAPAESAAPPESAAEASGTRSPAEGSQPPDAEPGGAAEAEVATTPPPASGTSAEPEASAGPEAAPDDRSPDTGDERDERDPASAGEALAPEEGLPSRGDDERSASVLPSSEPDSPGTSAGDDRVDDESAATRDASEPEASSSLEWPAARVAIAAIAGYASVPGHAFRAALEGELRIGDGRSSWSSSLSLAYARGNDAVAPGDLGLTLFSLELALCPPSIIAGASVWLSACASVRGGRVRLAFTSTLPEVDARDAWRPWLAVGPSLRAGVPLSEHWSLRGVAQLAVQLVRDTFEVSVASADDPAPQRTIPVYRPEPISVELGAGVGYSF